jgi:hypothetical protein
MSGNIVVAQRCATEMGIPYSFVGMYRCFGVDIATTRTRAELWPGGLAIEGVASAGTNSWAL